MPIPSSTEMMIAVRMNCSVWPITRFRSGQILRFPKSVVPN